MWLGAAGAGAQQPPPPPRDLPLVEVPAPAPRGTLAVLVTGDGSWAGLVDGVARELAAAGVGVVGLKVRGYLRARPRTADGMAGDLARIVDAYAPRWGAQRIAFVGYSRGAELLPLAIPRLPATLRARVVGVALVGMDTTANFRFRWVDLVTNRAHPEDVPLAPALPGLRASVPAGARIVCVYGVDERTSGCRGADRAFVTAVALPGEHHFRGDARAVARAVLGAVAP